VLRKNSIQTGFGSVRTPPTIEQFDPGFTNSGNQITVQKDIRNVGTCDDLGVCHLEIFAFGDGSIHQTFDLTHGVRFVWYALVLHGLGGIATPCGRFPKCHTQGMVWWLITSPHSGSPYSATVSPRQSSAQA